MFYGVAICGVVICGGPCERVSLSYRRRRRPFERPSPSSRSRRRPLERTPAFFAIKTEAIRTAIAFFAIKTGGRSNGHRLLRDQDGGHSNGHRLLRDQDGGHSNGHRLLRFYDGIPSSNHTGRKEAQAMDHPYGDGELHRQVLRASRNSLFHKYDRHRVESGSMKLTDGDQKLIMHHRFAFHIHRYESKATATKIARQILRHPYSYAV